MRLIDADKLIENKFKNDISYNAFVNLVKRQPTVDAVQVVRCKDCKHGKFGCPEDLVCDYWDSDGLGSNDFCSFGERRTDE